MKRILNISKKWMWSLIQSFSASKSSLLLNVSRYDTTWQLWINHFFALTWHQKCNSIPKFIISYDIIIWSAITSVLLVFKTLRTNSFLRLVYIYFYVKFNPLELPHPTRRNMLITNYLVIDTQVSCFNYSGQMALKKKWLLKIFLLLFLY